MQAPIRGYSRFAAAPRIRPTKALRGGTQYDQSFHADYTNHTMLPPRADGRYRQVQMFLYLSDVTLPHGATRIVSKTLTGDVPVRPARIGSARIRGRAKA